MLLYGAGGHAKVILDCLLEEGKEVEGFFDSNLDLVSLNGHSVLGEYDAEESPECHLIVSIGDNKRRQNIVSEIKHKFGNATHPSAIVSKFARIDVGTMIVHGAVVQSGVDIGKHCILNTLSSVDHDSKVGDFVHISPRACVCSSVRIGSGTHLGAGATVLPGVTIGKWCVIGAGAVVNKDIPDYSIVVGVPGRVVRTIEQEI